MLLVPIVGKDLYDYSVVANGDLCYILSDKCVKGKVICRKREVVLNNGNAIDFDSIINIKQHGDYYIEVLGYIYCKYITEGICYRSSLIGGRTYCEVWQDGHYYSVSMKRDVSFYLEIFDGNMVIVSDECSMVDINDFKCIDRNMLLRMWL